MAPRRQRAERRAEEDGVAYTLAEFKEYYGEKPGQKQWDWAGGKAAPKAKAKAKAKVKAKAKEYQPRKPHVDAELLAEALKEATSKPTKTVHLVAPIEQGTPESKDFKIVETPVPEVPEGGLLLQTLYISPDPYMRGGMKSKSGAKADMVIRGFICGRVLDSKSKKWSPGDFLGTHGPFSTVQILSEESLQTPMLWRLTGHVDESTASHGVGVLGMPGSTAYGGLLGVLRPLRQKKKGEPTGETLFVNAASGAVGQIVGQLAKSRGVKVIGSAGGPEKCKILTEKFGFDHTVDYKSVADADALAAKLKESAPDGIDMYFENVGGIHWDAAMKCMRARGRVAVCGCISSYNSGPDEPKSTNALSLGDLIYPQIRIEGFTCGDWLQGKKLSFLKDMSRLVKRGDIQVTETIHDGIESFGEAFKSLFTGANNGKVSVKLCDAKALRKPKEDKPKAEAEAK